MRALISCSPGLPLLIILDRAIHGCSVEKKKNKKCIVCAGSVPKPPQVTGKKKRGKKRQARGPRHVPFGVFPHRLFTVAFGKGKVTLLPTWS